MAKHRIVLEWDEPYYRDEIKRLASEDKRTIVAFISTLIDKALNDEKPQDVGLAEDASDSRQPDQQSSQRGET